jgi:hypothetical protein
MPLVTASSNRELDEILDLLGLSVQLTKTQFDRAETSYYAVAEWLRAPDSLVRVFGPEIFAQGSLRLDTTVRPLSYTERSYWIPGSWHLRMSYTDDVSVLNP